MTIVLIHDTPNVKCHICDHGIPGTRAMIDRGETPPPCFCETCQIDQDRLMDDLDHWWDAV